MTVKFDLERWGDGTLRLVHWDSLHGDDVVIEIEKGAAYLHRYVAKTDGAVDVDDLEEVVTEIGNLPAFLEKLMKERGNA